MELHHLHIGERRADVEGERHTVAGILAPS
jgi:hypothetical protein